MGGLAGTGGSGEEKSFCPDRDSRAVHQPGVVFRHPGGNLSIDGKRLKIGFGIEKRWLSFQSRFTQRLFLLIADILRLCLNPERQLGQIREIVPAKVKNLVIQTADADGLTGKGDLKLSHGTIRSPSRTS